MWTRLLASAISSCTNMLLTERALSAGVTNTTVPPESSSRVVRDPAPTTTSCRDQSLVRYCTSRSLVFCSDCPVATSNRGRLSKNDCTCRTEPVSHERVQRPSRLATCESEPPNVCSAAPGGAVRLNFTQRGSSRAALKFDSNITASWLAFQSARNPLANALQLSPAGVCRSARSVSPWSDHCVKTRYRTLPIEPP